MRRFYLNARIRPDGIFGNDRRALCARRRAGGGPGALCGQAAAGAGAGRRWSWKGWSDISARTAGAVVAAHLRRQGVLPLGGIGLTTGHPWLGAVRRRAAPRTLRWSPVPRL